MKILVCDDREPDCASLIEAIQGAISEEATIEGLSSTKLGKTLETFFKSIKSFLNGDCRSHVERLNLMIATSSCSTTISRI